MMSSTPPSAVTCCPPRIAAAAAPRRPGRHRFKLGSPGRASGFAFARKYSGPPDGDRIISLDGREIANAASIWTRWKVTEDKLAVATVQPRQGPYPHGNPHHCAAAQSGISASGRYLPDDQEIQIVSRTVTEMHITVPPQWAKPEVLWNGFALENIQGPAVGCSRCRKNF
jgi:hypothetical protein